MTPDTFADLRYGLFIHYGLYSLLGRGEWVMNRERISPAKMREIAGQFRAEHFDAEALCDLAVRAGMRYAVLTTMHHEGFRLYDTQLSDFKSTNTPCRRDLVAEFTKAARKKGLTIGLYHSLNNWFDQPDSVCALENASDYSVFIDNTFARLRELVTNYDFDIMWYDGWWPFNAHGWQAERMNHTLRALKPGLLFNPRNGLSGDFCTPEGHMSIPSPWRPWEACLSVNRSWGYHRGDHNWKSPQDILSLLLVAAKGRGNLLLNVGPRPDGSIPQEAQSSIEAVGQWLQTNGEAIYPVEPFTMNPYHQSRAHRGDFCQHGTFTVSGNQLYLVATSWPGPEFTFCGLQCRVESVSLLGQDGAIAFKQDGDAVTLLELPEPGPGPLPTVIRFQCDAPPAIYGHGGMRVPTVPHPRYDPVHSDIAW